jgi:hypothetical protein
MASIESNLSSSGVTTVPKHLRDQLALPNGARLRWYLLDDGTLRVALVHRYVVAPARSESPTPVGALNSASG